MKIQLLTIDDDLEHLVAKINSACWDSANDIVEYSVSALRTYLTREGTIFLACYETSAEEDSALLGIASSRIEIKPYDCSQWLYVDELDVCADKRRSGAGTFMMQALIKIAEERGCDELWLGTESDNIPANALYRSLKPDEVTQFIGYTYEFDI